MERCKKCGYPLLPKHDKCPKCGASVIEQAVTPIDGVDVVSRKTVWSIAPGQLARRISEKELADCSAVNGVVIQDGVTAAIFVDGQLANVMGKQLEPCLRLQWLSHFGLAVVKQR